MATEKRAPLGMQQPLQFDFSDPKRLEKLAMTMDPAAGQLLLSIPPEQFQMLNHPQGEYMNMLSPRNENGVNLSPQYEQQLQQNFNLGSQAAAESQVPLEAFGGAGPAVGGGGGINYMALLGLANAATQGRKQGPTMPPAFAVAPSNQWKGFQAQPLQVPATRQRAGSLAQILGMR